MDEERLREKDKWQIHIDRGIWLEIMFYIYISIKFEFKNFLKFQRIVDDRAWDILLEIII